MAYAIVFVGGGLGAAARHGFNPASGLSRQGASLYDSSNQCWARF